MRAVRTLLGIADLSHAEVDFEATIRSPEVVVALGGLLPDLRLGALAGKDHGSSESGADPAAFLPIRVFDWCRPLRLAEPFVAALGPEPAAVRWDLNGWPEVPETAL